MSDADVAEWDELGLVRALVHDLRHCGGKLANASDANRKVAGKAAGELAVLALNAADCISYLSVTILALGGEREKYKAALLEELAPPPLPNGEEQLGELLSCPFCGGAPAVIDIDEGENAGGSCIECSKCSASSNLEFGRKENFRSNWNRRAVVPRELTDEEAERGARAYYDARWGAASLSDRAWKALDERSEEIAAIRAAYRAITEEPAR